MNIIDEERDRKRIGIKERRRMMSNKQKSMNTHIAIQKNNQLLHNSYPLYIKIKKVNSISINTIILFRDVFGLYLSQILLRNISHQ